MHLYPGNCVSIGRAVVYYAHAFGARSKCHHCTCTCPGNCMSIGRAVVYYAHAFGAGSKCRPCTCPGNCVSIGRAVVYYAHAFGAGSNVVPVPVPALETACQSVAQSCIVCMFIDGILRYTKSYKYEMRYNLIDSKLHKININ